MLDDHPQYKEFRPWLMWFCACVCSYSQLVWETEEHFSLQITRMNGIPLAKHLAQQGCVCWKQIGRMMRRLKSRASYYHRRNTNETY